MNQCCRYYIESWDLYEVNQYDYLFFLWGNNMEEREIIACNIKNMREASDYTQEEVASFLGIKRSAYSNYETGDRELPLSFMEKLADLYGCDAYLMYEEDADIVKNMLTTAFRIENASPEDMEQIAAFKRVVKNSLMMDRMLGR